MKIILALAALVALVFVGACSNPADIYRMQGCKATVKDVLVSMYGQEAIDSNPEKLAAFSEAKCRQVLGIK